MRQQATVAIASWDQGGKATLSSLLAASRNDGVASNLLIYSFLRSHARLSSTQVVAFLTEEAAAADAEGSSLSPSPSTFQERIADAIWTIDAELDDERTAVDSEDPARKAAFDREAAQWVEVCQAIFANGLVPPKLYDRFEFKFLERLGVLRDANSLNKRSTRLGTVTFFSLKKFNLLRESSEGFSLLIILLTSSESLGPGSDPRSNGRDLEAPELRRARAQEVWKRVMGIIGYFDLDPSRTLDVIYDAFIASITTHHRFFVDLLRCSTWAAPKPTAPINAPDMDLAFENGSSVAAQVLGFKFRHYQDQSIIRNGEETPREMYLMAGVMIKEGLVQLKHLLEHLSPSEEVMKKHESSFRMAVADQARSAKGNALLAAAAPLVDDTFPADVSAEATAATTPTPVALLPLPEQKVALVPALLAVGANDQASHLLTRYPHLINAVPEIADIQLYALEISLRPVLAQVTLVTTPGAGLPAPSFVDASAQRSPKLTTVLPEPRQTEKKRFVWFYPEWSEGIEECESVDEIFGEKLGIERRFRTLGGQVGRNLALLVRLLRIARLDVAKNLPTEGDGGRWAELIKLVFLPSLSLHGTPPVQQEMWNLLGLYPLTTRYGFYGFWKALYTTSIQLKVRAALADRDSKMALRRISKEDIKYHSRVLGKIGTRDPLILWATALKQVQSYENLSKAVIEAARFLLPLGADVLVFTLLDGFSNPDKERTKDDGTSVSLWLKSLASFAGEMCRRHSTFIDPKPILQYVSNQLFAGNAKDLVILREMLATMTGVEPLANLSDTQVSSLSGGAALRGEAITPTVPTVKRPPEPGVEERKEAPIEKKGMTNKSSVRLIESLKDSRLTLPLLIVTGQTLDRCLYGVPDAEAHMKSLSTLFDSSKEVFLQYVDFLVQFLGPEGYASLIPSYPDLAERFGLSTGVAFHILRPKLAHDMKAHDLLIKTAPAESAESKEARLRQELKDSKQRTPALAADFEVVGAASSTAANGNGTATPTSMPVPIPSSSAAVVKQGKYHAVLEGVITGVLRSLPKEAKTEMGAPFFVTFWQLSPYDIDVPVDAYQHEINRLTRAKTDLERFPTVAKTTAWKADVDRLDARVKQLTQERVEQMEAVSAVNKRLKVERLYWFRKFFDSKKLNVHLHQHCVFPRAILSLQDAAFSAKLLRKMHSLGTVNFSPLWYHAVHTFSEHLASVIASLTEAEARNYAHFIHDVLDEYMGWIMDENRYRKECHGEGQKELLPGFRSRALAPEVPTPLVIGELLPFQAFKKVVHKWHLRLLTCFEQCMDSLEYMHIKNVVIIFQKILPFFPFDRPTGERVQKKLDQSIAREKRSDLKINLQSYRSQLGKLSVKWVAPREFYDPNWTANNSGSSPANSAHGSPAPTSASAARVTDVKQAPQDSPSSSGLSPLAPPFKPSLAETKPASTDVLVKPKSSLPDRPSSSRSNSQHANGAPASNTLLPAKVSPTDADKSTSQTNGSSSEAVRGDARKNPRGDSSAPPTGPKSQQQSKPFESSSSSMSSRPEMQPPSGPSSARGAIDTRSSAKAATDGSSSFRPARERSSPPPSNSSSRGGPPLSSSRPSSPPPSRGGSDRSRKRSRSPAPAHRLSRAGSADSSHSHRSGSRRSERERERERDRERERERGLPVDSRERERRPPVDPRESERVGDRDRGDSRRHADKEVGPPGGGGGRRGPIDRERERERDERNSERERRFASGVGGGGRPERDGGRGDLRRVPSPDRGPSSSRRGEPAPSHASRGGRDALPRDRDAPSHGRDTPPLGRARSPPDARDDRDSKRAKVDKDALAPPTTRGLRSSATDPQPSRGGDRKQSEGKDRRSDPRDESDHRPRESGRGSDRQLASSSSRDAAPSSREPAISPRGDEKPADRGDRERERERERDRDRGRRGRESNRQEMAIDVKDRRPSAPVVTEGGGISSGGRSLADRLSAATPTPGDKTPPSSERSKRDPPSQPASRSAAPTTDTSSSSTGRAEAPSQESSRKREREDTDSVSKPPSKIVRAHRYGLDAALKAAVKDSGPTTRERDRERERERDRESRDRR